MKRRYVRVIMLAFSAVVIYSCQSASQSKAKDQTIVDNSPKIRGAMKNVMRKGELFATINIDTIGNKEHIYGLGPVEYLTGEIMLFDGKGYKAEVVNDTAMKVTETFALKAPFFGYANIGQWTKVVLPDSIVTIAQLETYLDQTTKDHSRPYFFKIAATADTAVVHIVNLPPGIRVSSPEEAHQGQRNYAINGKKVDILGFFSTEHKAILTHHDTYLHMHLITEDRTKMGHLEKLNIKKGMAELYLPAEQKAK